MRIGSSTSSPASLEELPVEAQIGAELMSQDMEAQRAEGAAALQLIDAATAGVNSPLSEWHIGRRINIRI